MYCQEKRVNNQRFEQRNIILRFDLDKCNPIYFDNYALPSSQIDKNRL